MPRDPLRIAVFRLEQISPLLDPHLAPAERHRLVLAAARTPVQWPSGRHAPVPASTLYRWLARYRSARTLEALLSRPRPASRKAPVIPREWVLFALALLEEEPARSLYILGRKLEAKFNLPRLPARSSLHRALRREGRYAELRRRARGERRLRVRFEAHRPHQIWQADAKGKFWVHFADGSSAQISVLSLLDDATRVIVRGLVVVEETAAAAIATFRQAVARYGAPDALYADRGSAYDSYVFRKGIALVGVHRIGTRPRNAPAHGKIEAYHRALKRWFVKELKHQVVRDLAHLQELFDAWLDRIYHTHRHSALGMTPRQAMGDARSEHPVSLARLRQAFLIERILTAHPKDGTVRVAGTFFRVPTRLVVGARKVKVLVDPEAPRLPYIETAPGRLEALPPAVRKTGPTPGAHDVTAGEEPAGSLTPLLEQYRGRTLPLAQPGFGLPEIYAAFARELGRPVPATEGEAATVAEWLARLGPFAGRAFHAALARVRKRLGAGRPLTQILRALGREVRPAAPPRRRRGSSSGKESS